MPANTLGINQISTVLNAVMQQATGNSDIAAITGGDLITVGQKQLLTGYDNLINSVSQVLSRTIFSIRPYDRKFGGLMADMIRYGNHVRKINPLMGSFRDDQSLPLTEGESVDQYKVCKPGALQLNFYGQNRFEKCQTIFRDQMDVAFQSLDEFERFMAMIGTQIRNEIEKAHESIARVALGNFVTGIMASRPNDVIHLLTEYNAATGQTLTDVQVYLPDNFGPFMKWVYSRIASVSSMMTEWTTNFHTNLTNANIARHTPMRMQKVYLYAPAMYQYTSMVLADTYHDTFLRYADVDTVNYWQAIDSPQSLNMTPTYLTAAGALEASTAAITTDKLFGVIFDEEAVGYTVINYNVDTSPYNAAGRYNNVFWHFVDRYWNDFTENGVVLLLD